MINSDTTTSTQAGNLYGSDVVDSEGNKIGSVDGVWVDDASGQPEFISVKTGSLFGKDHIMPIERAQTNGNTIQVPYSSDQIQGGPSFGTDDQLSPDDEQQIYNYYGLDRQTDTTPTGYAGGDTDTTQTNYTSGQYQGTGNLTTQSNEIDVPVVEEELAVGKRSVQAGQVRLRKVVETEHVEQPVELRREDVEIERVPVSGNATQIPGDAFQEGEVTVPLMAEEAVAEKQARVTGQVRLTKNVETTTQTVEGDVRRTDVEVEGDDDFSTNDNPNYQS